MTPDFDIVIVGSGPAGVSVAFPLVEAGLRVLMVDGGKRPDITPPEIDFLISRENDFEQWKWMLGNDFYALKMRDAVSPKLRVPSYRYVFDGFEECNRIESKDFITVGSLSTGGLSNAWGCGVACFSEEESASFPFLFSDLKTSYHKVANRIGISGRAKDDLSDYFGLDACSQSPVSMDELHAHILNRYWKNRKKINKYGLKLGRSRVAALSEDHSGRFGCGLSGNCLWGCAKQSLYSAVHDLNKLRKFKNFTEISGFIVNEVGSVNGLPCIKGVNIHQNEVCSISAKKAILAAGTLASTSLALKALKYEQSVPLKSCPTAAFLLFLPRLLGMQRVSGFGLGQLSFTLSLADGINSFGSTFSTTGILLSEFSRYVPLSRRFSIEFLRSLLSSSVIGNVFLPGSLTEAEIKLKNNVISIVSGKYSANVELLMNEAQSKLRSAYWKMGAALLPGSFTIGRPGGDIHYAATLPMKLLPNIGETSPLGEIEGLKDIHVVDGACLPILTEKSHTLSIMANADRIGRKLSRNMILSM